MNRIVTRLSLSCCALSMALACQPQPPASIIEDRGRVPDVDPERESDPYTPEMLQSYRRALPSESALKAPQPQSDMQAQVGDTALYPSIAAPQVMAVNDQVRGLVHVLRAVTDQPPTIYNSQTQEFLWGPLPNGESALSDDYVLVYIKDNGESADFRFSYAFIRGIGNDMANLQPVIWGAAQPGPTEDDGHGLALFDLEANHAFESAHNPNLDDTLARGRFALAFGVGDDQASGARVAIVVSTFRDFRPEGGESAPVHMDQLYGHVRGADGNTVDFVSILAAVNVNEGESNDALVEDVDLRLAFLNGGHGRAEAVVSGGDLAGDNGGSVILGTECWDALIARTYLELAAEGEIAADSPDGRVVLGQEGELAQCGPIFSNTLDDIRVPSLDDMNPEHLAALDHIATHGIGN